MANAQDINAALADLAAANEASNGKADKLIVLVTQLRDQGGASAAELDAILVKIADMKTSVVAQGAEDDAALTA